MSIFKAYDVRGIYPSEINEDEAYKIGRAFVSFLKAKKIVVGYDMRVSSVSLYESFVKGVTDQGCDVDSIGLVPTPLLNFSVAKYGYDAGAIISASHNPGNYNGIKLIGKKALQISEYNGMKEIESAVKRNEFKSSEKKGSVSKKETLNDYTNHVLKLVKISNLNVVVDYGNGIGAVSAKPVFDKLPLKVTSLYDKPDGNFPNHPANPHDLINFHDLQNEVKKKKADLGIFFDGDADRSMIVDENGEIIRSDILLAILSENELKKHPKQKIYYDLRSTRILKETILKAKGEPVMLRVGNPFYKEKLINEGGILGGEYSGHIMFKENYGIDDGLFAALKFMDVMSKTKKKASEIAAPFLKYHKEDEMNIKVQNPDKVINDLKLEFSDKKIFSLDGLSVEDDDWWFNIRKSNTEPLIRINMESKTKKQSEMLKKKIMAHI